MPLAPKFVIGIYIVAIAKLTVIEFAVSFFIEDKPSLITKLLKMHIMNRPDCIYDSVEANTSGCYDK